MGVRLIGQHLSQAGILYKVEVIDSDGGGGSPVDLVDGYDLMNEGETKNPHHFLNPQRLSFTMYLDEGNSNHRSFIEDLKLAQEDRFFVKAYRNGNLEFRGRLAMESYSYRKVPNPFPFSLVATCGLGSLASVEYSDDGVPYEGKQTFVEHVGNCLSKLAIADLYGSDECFVCVLNWYSNEMPNTSDNPWEMSGVDHELFIKRDQDGNPEFMNCLSVLEETLKPHGASIKTSEGYFFIYQFPSRFKETFVGWGYTIDGSLYSQRTYNMDVLIEQNKANFKESGFKLNDSSYSSIPPLRSVAVELTYTLDVKQLAVEAEWNSLSADTCAVNFFRIVPENPSLRIQGMLRLNSSNLTSDFVPHRYYFRMKISFSTGWHYVRIIQSSQVSNIIELEPEWENAFPGGYYELASPLITAANNHESVYVPILIETAPLDPPVPYGLGVDVTVCFELVDIFWGSNASLKDAPGDHLFFWVFDDVQLDLVDSESDEQRVQEKTKQFKSDDNASNDKTLTIPTIMGDDAGNVHTIFIKDGSDWLPSTGWGVGAGGAKNISELLIDQILSVRSNPIEVLNTSFTGKHYVIGNTFARYLYDNTYYFFHIGNKFSNDDRIFGEFFAVQKITPSVTVTVKEIVKKAQVKGSNTGKDTPPGNNEGITSIGAAIKEGDAVTSIVIPAATYNYFSLGDVIDVRDPLTGARQTFTVATDTKKGDTSISVVSATADTNLSQDSKVIFEWAYESGQTYNETKERYELVSVENGNITAGATEILVTDLILPDPSVPIAQARKRVRPERNGLKMRLVESVAAYTGNQPMRVFEIITGNKIKLHATAPVDEWDEFDFFGFEIVK